ncbi:MAG: glycosyltransferase family 39 protein [Lachnospiraceae bacterium]|nr:glycosyltransferase family 39 protein [Lachnospiraceae bacterium]
MKTLLFQNTKKISNMPPAQKTNLCLILTIILSCLLVAFAQGSSFFYSTHYTKVLVLTCFFLAYAGIFFYMKAARRLDENGVVFMMILLGVFLRCSYVLLSGLYHRQHDAGAYTGIGTDFVNPGHIGYVEYIYKFHKLPDLNPYELFAYYHPPLHHILSFIWLQLNILLGVAEDLAFENLQVLTLLYSCLCMVVTWRILKVLEIREKGLYIALAFMVFHPATIVMAGSVNNDMLTILFMCLIILESLKWLRNKNLAGLIRLALYIGLGMITKLNSAVLAIPLAILFLKHFVSVIRSKDKPLILQWIKNYCIFAVVVAPIGLSWIVRNLVRFSEKPGVPVPGETSPMYTAPFSLWERLGIPAFSDWNFAFPFHPISAKACSNTWVIMFHTSLFAEEYPTDLSDVLLVLCQITFLFAVIFGIFTAVLLVAVLLNKRTNREDTIFLLAGYVIMLISFAAFVIIYPYTCSSDFRYVAICLVYISIALGLGNKYYISLSFRQEKDRHAKLKAFCMHMINGGILSILTFITIIYVFWERW